MTTTSTLASRLAAASVAVGALATDKRNAQQGYDYISADKILERCGDALAHAGVILIPSITAEDTQAIEVTTNRGTGIRYDAAITFAMTLTDGETTLEFPWRGRGSDYAVPDKALYKAITSGHKYFMMKLLNVGVGNEDGEHEAAEAPQKAQQQPAARNTPRAAAPRAAAPFGTDAKGVTPQEDIDLWETDAPTVWYTAARNSTINGVRKLCDTCLELHRTGGPASNEQYGYVVGLLDSVVKQATGAKDGHKRVLAVLCQTEISRTNPCSAALANKLLDRVATHVKDADGEKIPNPEYSQPVADAMIVIYRAAEAVGTPSLLPA